VQQQDYVQTTVRREAKDKLYLHVFHLASLLPQQIQARKTMLARFQLLHISLLLMEVMDYLCI